MLSTTSKMNKTVIKCVDRISWHKIMIWAEEIKPECTRNAPYNEWRYFGFDENGEFKSWYYLNLPKDYKKIELPKHLK